MQVALKGETELPMVKAGEARKMLAMASLQAPELKEEEGEQRAAVKICAVIDRSGSMRGVKLQMVAQTLEFVVRELSPNDEFGIIAYDNHIQRTLDMQPMTKENQVRALAAIRGIRPGGATNLSGGLLQGMKEIIALKGKAKDAAASTPASHCVWLFTDGHANEGITSTEGITAAMDEYLGDGSNMIVHTFGFGTSHNDGMLRSLAEAGNGQYYYIEDASVIKETFAECLGGLLTVVATNLSVTMQPAEGVEVVSCLNDLTIDLNNLSFNLKDIYSEETRDFVVEFNLPSVASTESFKVATVVLKYTDFEGKEQEDSIVITVPRPETVDEDTVEVNEGLDMQRNRLETANALKQAQSEANRGDFEKAKQTINLTQAKIKSAKYYERNQACQDLWVDLEAASGNMTRSTWAAVGSKSLNKAEMSHRMKRSCGTNTKYKTKKQSCMITQSKDIAEDIMPIAPVSDIQPAAQIQLPTKPQAKSAPDGLLSSIGSALSFSSKKKKKAPSMPTKPVAKNKKVTISPKADTSP